MFRYNLTIPHPGNDRKHSCHSSSNAHLFSDKHHNYRYVKQTRNLTRSIQCSVSWGSEARARHQVPDAPNNSGRKVHEGRRLCACTQLGCGSDPANIPIVRGLCFKRLRNMSANRCSQILERCFMIFPFAYAIICRTKLDASSLLEWQTITC